MEFFPGVQKINVSFCTPKIHTDDLIEINKIIDKIKTILKFKLKNLNLKYDLNLIVNADFYTEILIKTIEKSNTISDTSALFIRAVRLLYLDPNKKVNPINKVKVSTDVIDDKVDNLPPLLNFYPNFEQVKKEVKLNNKYFVIALNSKNEKIDEFKFDWKATTSSLRSLILSKNQFRKKGRENLKDFSYFICLSSNETSIVNTAVKSLY